jgi:predicted PurR-regulated permease PerM
VLKLFPTSARDAMAGAGPRAWATLTGYIRGTLTIAFIDALFIGIGIALLGVPMAVPLAVVVFLGAFVPLVGALISGILAVAVSMVTQGPVTALLVLAVVVGVQQIEGHLLQPFILGRAVKVHPLAVVLAVTSGSLLAGIGGAVVAVPLVAVVNSVAVHLVRYRRQQRQRRGPAVGAAPGAPSAAVDDAAEESKPAAAES